MNHELKSIHVAAHAIELLRNEQGELPESSQDAPELEEFGAHGGEDPMWINPGADVQPVTEPWIEIDLSELGLPGGEPGRGESR